MAERRMFHTGVVESDAFLDLPLAAQALYFHIGMHADDDGFVNGPKQITRMLGASPDDLTALIDGGFLLWFDGIAVVRHWLVANSLKADRLKPVQFPGIASSLSILENREYILSDKSGTATLFDLRKAALESKRNPKVRKGKVREDNIREDNIKEANITADAVSGEGPEDAAAADEKKMFYLKGSLGKGVVLLSDEQISDLLEKMGLDSFDYYVDKLATYILKNNAKVKSHYQTILKWWTEDRSAVQLTIDN